jgi:hypothetical protein
MVVFERNELIINDLQMQFKQIQYKKVVRGGGVQISGAFYH